MKRIFLISLVFGMIVPMFAQKFNLIDPPVQKSFYRLSMEVNEEQIVLHQHADFPQKIRKISLVIDSKTYRLSVSEAEAEKVVFNVPSHLSVIINRASKMWVKVHGKELICTKMIRFPKSKSNQMAGAESEEPALP